MGVDWESLLAPLLPGRVTLVAMGDRSAGDDAAALMLVDLLAGKASLPLLDCGSYPQNFLSIIARTCPHVVMLVDAAELGLLPGQVRVLDHAALADWGGSHGYPMGLLMEQIEALSRARVFLLGIQIGDLTRGQSCHPAVEETIRGLAEFLMSRYPARTNERTP
ncbi:hydrogenase maturation protease [Candidatus Fermentibacteria bacterium]|nr:hydrogenase maturation protease [Candidatus Fermentibacteria bacterium]